MASGQDSLLFSAQLSGQDRTEKNNVKEKLFRGNPHLLRITPPVLTSCSPASQPASVPAVVNHASQRRHPLRHCTVDSAPYLHITVDSNFQAAAARRGTLCLYDGSGTHPPVQASRLQCPVLHSTHAVTPCPTRAAAGASYPRVVSTAAAAEHPMPFPRYLGGGRSGGRNQPGPGKGGGGARGGDTIAARRRTPVRACATPL